MAQLVRHLIAPTRVFARPAVRASLAALVLLVMTVLPAAAAATGVVALASGSASPTSGTPSTVITFSVVYTNTDSKAPAYVRLHVAGKTLAMFPASGDGWKRGVKFTVSTRLEAGAWPPVFEAADRSGNSATLDGPTVTIEVAPTPTPTPKPTPTPTPKPTATPT
ncbi:MAG: hypothetical protein WCK58_11510, partial [Chloroflexota bacterium]